MWQTNRSCPFGKDFGYATNFGVDCGILGFLETIIFSLLCPVYLIVCLGLGRSNPVIIYDHGYFFALLCDSRCLHFDPSHSTGSRLFITYKPCDNKHKYWHS